MNEGYHLELNKFITVNIKHLDMIYAIKLNTPNPFKASWITSIADMI